MPGSTRAKLLAAGMHLFHVRGYAAVEVDAVAAEAGVTVGALYHHFGSKQSFYGVLRDEMAQRVLDRMEAAAEVTQPEHRLRVALLAAYDGILRIKAGKLLAEPDPRGGADAIAAYFSQLVAELPHAEATMLGAILAAAVRAAVLQAGDAPEQQAYARVALQHLLGGGGHAPTRGAP